MASTTPSMGEAARGSERDLGDKIEELRQEMMQLSAHVQAYLQDRADELRDTAAETVSDVEDIIRGRPLPAVSVALGIGFVVGLMLGGARSRREPSRLSQRDFDRLASRLRGAIEAAGSRAQRAATNGGGDAAFLERLAGAITGLISSSRSTAASVGSVGEKAAKSVVAVGERTARTIADRLSHATH